jgi:hypothetical protein
MIDINGKYPDIINSALTAVSEIYGDIETISDGMYEEEDEALRLERLESLCAKFGAATFIVQLAMAVLKNSQK